MFVVPPYHQEIRLLWRDGSYLRFPSVLEAARFARGHGLLPPHRQGPIGDHLGPTERVYVGDGKFAWVSSWPDVVVRSEFGDVISEASLYAAIRRPWRWSWQRDPQRPQDYRRAPVPGVHKSRGYGYFRHPQTHRDLEEQARYLDDLAEVGLSAAKVGRIRHVVSAWDDIPRHLDHCWKRHRKTRYRSP